MEEILAMEHITKTYPGVKALDDVSISFIQGEVHAVMGENGAGKSTLMKILNGMIPADSGDIRFHGEKVAIRNPRDARALGIAMIHQELNPIKDLTVAENMFVGRYPQKGCFVDWSTMYDECRKLFEHWKVDFDPIYCLRTHMENHWLYMSLDTWNSLSADEQETVTKLAKEWEAEAYQLAKDNETKYIDLFTEKGVEVYVPSQDVVDAYADYVRTNVWPQIASEYGDIWNDIMAKVNE